MSKFNNTFVNWSQAFLKIELEIYQSSLRFSKPWNLATDGSLIHVIIPLKARKLSLPHFLFYPYAVGPLHWLSCVWHEQSRLTPADQRDIPGKRSCVLVHHTWLTARRSSNKIKSIAGNTVSFKWSRKCCGLGNRSQFHSSRTNLKKIVIFACLVSCFKFLCNFFFTRTMKFHLDA